MSDSDMLTSEDIINCSFIKNEVPSQRKYVKIYNEPSESSCTQSTYYDQSTDEPECKKRKNFNHPDVSTFRSLITPLSELTPVNAKTNGPIQFRMRRKNKVVTLQFEPFSGIITTTGISYLMLAQTICNLPPYTVSGVYNIVYNGILRQCMIEINPGNIKSNVLFYLNPNGTSENVNANDSIVVKGGCISWIVC
jgi:hypothetical protein